MEVDVQEESNDMHLLEKDTFVCLSLVFLVSIFFCPSLAAQEKDDGIW